MKVVCLEVSPAKLSGSKKTKAVIKDLQIPISEVSIIQHISMDSINLDQRPSKTSAKEEYKNIVFLTSYKKINNSKHIA